MIRSMTAYATAERATDGGTLACELRAVNHRFLELGLRLPEELRVLEPVLRERISARIARGKLDFSLRLRSPEGEGAVRVNQDLIKQLAAVALELDVHFPRLRAEFVDLLQYPGVLQSKAVDAEALQVHALAVLDALLDQFVAAREREGEKLAQAIGERVDALSVRAAEVRELIPLIRAGQRLKLEARLADVAHPAGAYQLEQGRVEQELVLWLQKLDVDEELDRLDSHIKEIRRVLKQTEPVGRRLDFLLQEFNREANTLGSKSVDVRTTNLAVELKVLIDQIREQVQNIE
jgi:conserved hypothetical protein TIGR00255